MCLKSDIFVTNFCSQWDEFKMKTFVLKFIVANLEKLVEVLKEFREIYLEFKNESGDCWKLKVKSF